MSLLEPLTSAAGAPTDAGASGAEGLRGAACNRWSVEREPEPAIVMSIIDVSGTMIYGAPGATASRWDIERSVLGDVIAALPAKVGFGALYFPNMATTPSNAPRPTSACVNLDTVVPIALLGSAASQQRTVLSRSLASTEPNLQGGAPTLDAYLAALDELGRTMIDGVPNMLLITDGQPTFAEGCIGIGTVDSPVDPTPLINAIYAARRAGVRTFVIGSPGSQSTNSRGDDARPWLSRAAEAGGTAYQQCSHSGPNFCHYDMTRESNFALGLRAALDDLQRRVIRCDIPLPVPPQNERLDPSRVNVVFTSAEGTSTVFPRDDSQGCSAGWRYTNDGRRVVLCDEACKAVAAELGSKLELIFGCDGLTR